MTIEITGAPEPPASDAPDVLQQDGVQMQDQASDTTVLITEAQVALGTAAAPGLRRKDRRWIAMLSRIFVPTRRNHARSGVLTNPAWRIWTTREWHARWSDCESFFVVALAATPALATAAAKPHTAPVSRREKGPTMLSAALGILAMLPVVFDVAGHAMVSR
ncbi:MAG: hypothetical protein QOJ56_2258 [Mycobacterium sp.]|jgi:hypothetical protein|nr:hypothetical protein [Mycobacterium sp.]